MTTPTGFVDLTGSGLDFVNLYEPRTSGPTVTTHYVSQTYGKDLGSIFIMNANLGVLGMNATNGTNCGHKSLNGTDLGSMFCVKGTVNALLNGGFTSPAQTTNSQFNNTSPTNSITNWIFNLGLNSSIQSSIYINKGVSGSNTIALTDGNTQSIGLQNYAANNIMNIYQSINLPMGSFTLSFYTNIADTLTVSNLDVYISTSTTLVDYLPTTGTYYLLVSGLQPSKTSWEKRTYNFTIPTAGTYYLYFIAKKNTSTGYSWNNITGVKIINA